MPLTLFPRDISSILLKFLARESGFQVVIGIYTELFMDVQRNPGNRHPEHSEGWRLEISYYVRDDVISSGFFLIQVFPLGIDRASWETL